MITYAMQMHARAIVLSCYGALPPAPTRVRHVTAVFALDCMAACVAARCPSDCLPTALVHA
eukprot:2118212-Alexandrium_andersonii.AAC.1